MQTRDFTQFVIYFWRLRHLSVRKKL